MDLGSSTRFLNNLFSHAQSLASQPHREDYTHTNTHTHTHTHPHTHAHTHTHPHTHPHTHARTHTHTHILKRTHPHTQTHANTHTLTLPYKYAYTMRVCTCVSLSVWRVCVQFCIRCQHYDLIFPSYHHFLTVHTISYVLIRC